MEINYTDGSGGFLVPPEIALGLLQLHLLQMLADRAGLGKTYLIDKRGMRLVS